MTSESKVKKIRRGARLLRVEVVYALPHRSVVIETQCRRGTTLAEVIRACGVLERFPEIDLSHNPVGVYGEGVALDTCVADGDRIEIYRPLIIDPKTARRRRHMRKSRSA